MQATRIAAATTTALAVVVFVVVLGRATLYSPSEEVAAPALEAVAPARDVTPADLPERLRIPALGIDTAVQQVGVKADGHMANPNNFTDVGWYKYGTVPGFAGSAVMAGHVDNGLKLAGVFKRLNELPVGAEVVVTTVGGETRTFVVTEVTSYKTAEVPIERLFTAADGEYLNLVTCDGAWVAGEKTYDRRLVVYARLIKP